MYEVRNISKYAPVGLVFIDHDIGGYIRMYRSTYGSANEFTATTTTCATRIHLKSIKVNEDDFMGNQGGK